jgi:CRISPR-associated protein Cas2
MYLLITYDITSDKKRRKVDKFLSEVGIRVNKSVFECEVKKVYFEELKEKLKRYMDKSDSIRIYRLDKSVLEKSIELNKNLQEPFLKEDSYV